MVPSWAVTTTVIVLLPTLRLIAWEAEPLALPVPLTVMVAPVPASCRCDCDAGDAVTRRCPCSSWWLLQTSG